MFWWCGSFDVVMFFGFWLFWFPLNSPQKISCACLGFFLEWISCLHSCIHSNILIRELLFLELQCKLNLRLVWASSIAAYWTKCLYSQDWIWIHLMLCMCLILHGEDLFARGWKEINSYSDSCIKDRCIRGQSWSICCHCLFMGDKVVLKLEEKFSISI